MRGNAESPQGVYPVINIGRRALECEKAVFSPCEAIR